MKLYILAKIIKFGNRAVADKRLELLTDALIADGEDWLSPAFNADLGYN